MKITCPICESENIKLSVHINIKPNAFTKFAYNLFCRECLKVLKVSSLNYEIITENKTYIGDRRV